MTILDDGSNGSVFAVLVAALLIGGIAGAIRGTVLLRRCELDGPSDALADDLMTGPWGSTHTPSQRPWFLP